LTFFNSHYTRGAICRCCGFRECLKQYLPCCAGNAAPGAIASLWRILQAWCGGFSESTRAVRLDGGFADPLLLDFSIPWRRVRRAMAKNAS